MYSGTMTRDHGDRPLIPAQKLITNPPMNPPKTVNRPCVAKFADASVTFVVPYRHGSDGTGRVADSRNVIVDFNKNSHTLQIVG